MSLLILLVSWNTVEPKQDESESVLRGKVLFNSTCMACHMANGEGIAGVFPPLAKSDYLMSDISRAAAIVIQGKTGEIEVNGTKYNGVMTGFAFSDQELADVINYITNSWGNNAKEVDAKWTGELRKNIK